MEKQFLIDTVLPQVIHWAREAGEIQLSYFRGNNLGIETKSNIYDVVTRADKQSEAFLVGKIQECFPGHSILGEESGSHEGTSDYHWVIDPLDGTNNFSQGLPIFCVSIGLQLKGETLLGVVYMPYLKELFTAVRGNGAYMNGQQIRVSAKNDLNQSVLGTGFPYDKDVNPDNNVDNVARILPHLRGLRRMGAAAYDLCCVAAGFLDGYWEFSLQPWDVCAGGLIVEEAGGVVYHFRDNRNVSVITGNPMIVEKIKEKIR